MEKLLSHFACRVCEGDDLQLKAHIVSTTTAESVPSYHCAECDHYSLFPTLYHDAKDFDWDGVAYYTHNEALRREYARRLLRRIIHVYEQRHGKPPKTFLDVGCAIGIVVEEASKLGLQAVGIEPELQLAAYGRDVLGLDVTSCMLADFQHPIGGFDIVFNEQVLEHIAEPVTFAKELSGQLADGGLLYLGIPLAYPVTIWMTHASCYLKLPSVPQVLLNMYLDPDEHISCFTRQSFRRLAEEAGLQLCDLPLKGAPVTLKAVIKRVMNFGHNTGAYLLWNQSLAS